MKRKTLDVLFSVGGVVLAGLDETFAAPAPARAVGDAAFVRI